MNRDPLFSSDGGVDYGTTTFDRPEGASCGRAGGRRDGACGSSAACSLRCVGGADRPAPTCGPRARSRQDPWDRPRHGRIVAPFVPDRPISGDAFTARVGQCLVPTLAPGEIGRAFPPSVAGMPSYSPGSRHGSARPMNPARKPHGGGAEACPMPSAQANARTVFAMPDTLQQETDGL